jgi:hypothetical protein
VEAVAIGESLLRLTVPVPVALAAEAVAIGTRTVTAPEPVERTATTGEASDGTTASGAVTTAAVGLADWRETPVPRRIRFAVAAQASDLLDWRATVPDTTSGAICTDPPEAWRIRSVWIPAPRGISVRTVVCISSP